MKRTEQQIPAHAHTPYGMIGKVVSVFSFSDFKAKAFSFCLFFYPDFEQVKR